MLLLRHLSRLLTFLAGKCHLHDPLQARNAHLVRRKRCYESRLPQHPFLASVPEEPKDYRATVEDAEDEEDVSSKKKKKPKKKKKKKKATNELPTVHEDSVPVISTPPKNPPLSTLAETPAKVPSNKLPASNVSLNSLAHVSTSSLPIEPTVAQSAHSYLQDLGAPKEKVKSRPDHASLFSDKRGFLSKLNSKDKTKKEDETDPTVNKKFTWFTNLGKKTAGYMHQLMRTNADEKAGSLKWDNFLKVTITICSPYSIIDVISGYARYGF